MKIAIAAVAVALLSSSALAQEVKDSLTIDLANDAATLDPHLQWDRDSYTIYRNIFDNLLKRDEAGEIAPEIATSWDYVDDTTIVFQIREGVTFQDGSELTAEDVAFSIERIIDPELQSPQLSQFDQIESAEATSPTEVRVITKSPYPVLLAQLVKLSIVPSDYVESIGNAEFNQKPIGSGPYRLENYQRGVETVLTANADYWEGPPPFQTVTFRSVPDVSTRVADLRSGRADLVGQLTPDQAISLEGEPGIEILSTPTERIGYLYLNAQSGPTTDVRVRQAIAHSIDRQGIVEALLQGYGEAVEIIGAPVIFGYTDEVTGYEYDPERARELVAEAGAEGQTVQFLTSPSYDRAIVEAIQQMINESGLVTEIVALDHASFLQRRQGPADGAGSMALGIWSCACQDADGIIFPLFRTDSIWAKYGNPEFDALVDAARATLDEPERLDLYKQAYAIIQADVPGIGIYQYYSIYGVNENLDWQPTASESMFIKEMGWGQ